MELLRRLRQLFANDVTFALTYIVLLLSSMITGSTGPIDGVTLFLVLFLWANLAELERKIKNSCCWY